MALWAIYLIWGSTYLAIAVGIRTLPPLVMAGTRFVVAGLVMLAVTWRSAPRRPNRIEVRNAAIIGTALCLGGNGLVTIAESRIASGTAALVVATVPLWLAGLDRLLFGTRLSRLAVGGLLAGFAGVALLVRPGGASDLVGILEVVAAAAIWACGSLFARRSDAADPPSLNVGLQMFAGGISTLAVATVGGEWARLDLSAVSLESTLAWLYLIVAGSIAGFSAYIWLLRNTPTSVAGTYAYVNPIIAIVLGTMFLDERLEVETVIAGGIIIVAVAAIIAGSGRIVPAETAAEQPA